ncbi:DNA-directed RNA polymerase subunit beta', partial [Neisseria sp. P0017.S005]
VQEVYRRQGVKFSDKHIEVIIGQLLRRVEFVASGDTEVITGEHVERGDVLLATEKARADDNEPARSEGGVLGGPTAAVARVGCL